MKFKIILLSSIFYVLLGCGSTSLKSTVDSVNSTAALNGSPYRWEHKTVNGGEAMKKILIGTPAPTSADAALEEFTREQISNFDNKNTISADQKPQEVRLVSASESHVQELWVYEVKGDRVIFVVNYQPAISGGTDINFTGPW